MTTCCILLHHISIYPVFDLLPVANTNCVQIREFEGCQFYQFMEDSTSVNFQSLNELPVLALQVVSKIVNWNFH